MRDLCERIAESVEGVVKPVVGSYEGAEVVGMGADGTPTKRIDRVAEDAALDVAREYGDIRVVSEESGEEIFGDPEITVVLDPVDGTYNASKGIPFYSVAIGVSRTDSVNDVFYAYVKDINHGEVYTARRGEGARLNGEPIEVSEESTPRKMTVGGVYEFAGFDPAEFGFQRTRVLGCASLELCYVASGKVDAFVDARSRLRVVDFAGAKLIAEEAGARVTDMYGDELENVLSVDQRSSIVAANPMAHETVLEVIE